MCRRFPSGCRGWRSRSRTISSELTAKSPEHWEGSYKDGYLPIILLHGWPRSGRLLLIVIASSARRNVPVNPGSQSARGRKHEAEPRRREVFVLMCTDPQFGNRRRVTEDISAQPLQGDWQQGCVTDATTPGRVSPSLPPSQCGLIPYRTSHHLQA